MGDNPNETLSNVAKADFDFDEEFEEISEEAKEFISALLVKDPRHRFSAKECLDHQWLNSVPRSRGGVLNKANLKKFLVRRRWQKCGQAIRAMKRMTGLVQHKKLNVSKIEETD